MGATKDCSGNSDSKAPRFQDNLGKDMSSVILEACLLDEPCLAGAALMILHGWFMGRDVTELVSLLKRCNNN